MLDNLQNTVDGLFGAIMGVTSAGAIALFDASVLAALGFYVWYLIKSLHNGGGALFESAAYRLFILFALSAVVNGWSVFATAIRNDILAFAARVSNIDPLVVGQFTPSGIIATNQRLTDAVYASGGGHSFQLFSVMALWKMAAIIFIQAGSAALALDLFWANISLAIVMAGCAVLIGLLVSPWLNSFAMQYVGLIVGTGVYVILIGVFVGIGQTLALLSVQEINRMPKGALIPGPHMLELGIISCGFAALAWVVPAWVASRITGGTPILQMGSLLSTARAGKANLGF